MINPFTAYDMALLYNCRLLVKSLDHVVNCDFSKAQGEIRRVLEPVACNSKVLNQESLKYVEPFHWGGGFVAGGKYKSNDYEISIGYWPELVGQGDQYLFSVAVPKDFVDMDKAANVDFLAGRNNQLYFPVTKWAGENINGKVSCAGATVELEENLDVCHSLIVFEKMQSLVFSSADSILEKLNESFKGSHFFSAGKDFYFKGIKCGMCIDVDGQTGLLYYGTAPNVFFESIVAPESAVVSDYFSTVAIIKDHCNEDSTSSLIKNGAQFGGYWCYYPICRKLLCVEDFQQRYILRVVQIITEGYI